VNGAWFAFDSSMSGWGCEKWQVCAKWQTDVRLASLWCSKKNESSGKKQKY
jgi:hypothetical protein